MSTTYRASVKAWIVMSVIFGGLTLLSLWIAIADHGSWWQAVGISGAVYLFVILWLLRFQIAISDTEVRFRSLWSSDAQVFHSRAIHAVLELGRRRGATVETNDLENGVAARAVRRRPRVRRG